jgi:ferredoxin-type protein NapF
VGSFDLIGDSAPDSPVFGGLFWLYFGSSLQARAFGHQHWSGRFTGCSRVVEQRLRESDDGSVGTVRLEVSRRQFLMGNLQGTPTPIRPPWALAEPVFLQSCTRCHECLSRCPQGILVAGTGGFPEVNLRRGECTFCGECVEACEPRALDSTGQRRGEAPWDLKVGIGRACFTYHGIACRVCADRCVASAIRFLPVRGGAFVPRLDRSVCNGCGACVAACPSHAVNPVHDPGADAVVETQERLAR